MASQRTGPCEQCEHYRIGRSLVKPTYDVVLPSYQQKLRASRTRLAEEERKELGTFTLEGESPPDPVNIEWSGRPPDDAFAYCGLDEFDGKYYRCDIKNPDEECEDFSARPADSASRPCAPCRHNRPPLAHPVQILEQLLGSLGERGGRLLDEEIRPAITAQAEDEYQECVVNAGFVSKRPAFLPVCMVRTSVKAATRELRYLVAPIVNSAEQCDQWSAGTNEANVTDTELLDALVEQSQDADQQYSGPSRAELEFRAHATAAVVAQCLAQLGAGADRIAYICDRVTQLYGHSWDPEFITSGQAAETARQLQERGSRAQQRRQAQRSREAESLRRAEALSDYVDWIGDELQKGEQGFYGSGVRHVAMPSYVQEIGTEFPAQERVVYVHPREPVAFYTALPQLRVHTGVSAQPGAWPLTNAPLSAQKFEMLKGSELLGIWHVPGFNPRSWILLTMNTIWVPLQVKVEGATLYARWGTSVLSAPPNVADFPRQASAEDAYNLGWSCEQKADYAAAEGWYRQAAEQGHTLAAILLGRLALHRDTAEGMRWLLWADSKGDLSAATEIATWHMYGLSRDLDEALRWYRRAATSENAEIRAVGEQGVQAVQAQLHPPHEAHDEEDPGPRVTASRAQVPWLKADDPFNPFALKPALQKAKSAPDKKRKSPDKKRKSADKKRKSEPARNAGPPARSGYDEWLAAGNVGDFSDYLASRLRKSEPARNAGPPATGGYDEWLAAGNVGDFGDYLASRLKRDD